ncbi:hypothetical protein K502DRAFT_367796 [Neoconidiobolus thromboides FSU 785]|nr:hypothetical protein K502DRAFT_367796 [Neoconidiobolus thromboides FSU 785]
MAIMETKGKRATLDLKTKRKIIEIAELGYSHQKIADKFNIGRSTVTKILLKKDVLLNTIESEIDLSRKRLRRTELNGLENKLATWYLEANINKSHIVDLQALKSQAIALAKEMGINNFNFDSAWIQKFCTKFRLPTQDQIRIEPVVKSNVPEFLFDLSSNHLDVDLMGDNKHSPNTGNFSLRADGSLSPIATSINLAPDNSLGSNCYYANSLGRLYSPYSDSPVNEITLFQYQQYTSNTHYF